MLSGDVYQVQTITGSRNSLGKLTIQTVKCYISALEQDRKLLLSMFVHLILMYNIYEYRHA